MTNNVIIEKERQRAELFLQKRSTVHIRKIDGSEPRFHNGLIVEVHADHIYLLDRNTGQKVLILFSELKRPIEMYQEEVRE